MGRANLIMFARAPVVGMVKRRLAADIGALAARRFYARTTADVLARLARDGRWRTWLAVTPDRFAEAGRFWRRGVRRLPQGRGDLGQRMGRAMRRFPGAPAVLVGSDIPELRPAHIAAAIAALGSHEAVLGPAADGGYWLVGLRDGRALPGMFDGVRWSSPHALADTLANLRGRRVALLETLDDVDDGAGLRRWQARAGAVKFENALSR